MFIFLTELFAKRVRRRRGTGGLLGRPVDLVANAEEVYPAVVGFMVRRGRRPAFYLPWSQIASVGQDEILVRGAPEAPGPAQPPEGSLYARRHVLDRQIIDTSGARVVRVNDLHLLRMEDGLRLIHVDVGASGLFRRLGWLPAVNALTRGSSTISCATTSSPGSSCSRSGTSAAPASARCCASRPPTSRSPSCTRRSWPRSSRISTCTSARRSSAR